MKHLEWVVSFNNFLESQSFLCERQIPPSFFKIISSILDFICHYFLDVIHVLDLNYSPLLVSFSRFKKKSRLCNYHKMN